MKTLSKNNKTFLYGVAVFLILIFCLVLYGVYDKNKKQQLYVDFKANKKLKCGDVLVQKSRGWRIKNNRFFSNGKNIKTIVFCKSYP